MVALGIRFIRLVVNPRLCYFIGFHHTKEPWKCPWVAGWQKALEFTTIAQTSRIAANAINYSGDLPPVH